MKILLVAINAKYIHSNLAVYSLQAYSGRSKEEVEIKEYTINQYVDDILVDIYETRPDVIAFSCYIWNIEMVRELAIELKKVLPQVPIWVGGPEVSYEIEMFLKENPAILGVIIGEGEETFRELANYYLEQRGALGGIAGLCYRKDENFVYTPMRKMMEMDQLPFPYKNMENFQHKIVYYETSRGCPFRCSYCLSSIEKQVRLRDLSLVKKELDFFLEHKVPQVKFIDRTFNCNHAHAMAIWSYIKEHDNGITNFHFEISADLLNEEELALLQTMRIGLVQLEIGVQSTHPETIAGIHRKMNLEKLSYAVGRIAEGENIHQHLDLIAGLPYEDYETFRHSFNDVFAMQPNQLQLGFLKVLKGSRMYEEQGQHGIVYKSKAPYEVLSTKWLTYEEVLRLKAVEEMVERYYNSCQFSNSVSYLLHFYTSPFDFFQALGLYVKAHAQLGHQYGRLARYEQLLDFVKDTKPELVEPLCELLVYDVYLRENSKTRPSFAPNIDGYKDVYYDTCKEIQNRLEEGREERYAHYQGYQARQLVRMLHFDYFTFDLESLVKEGIQKKKPQHLVFDYQKRHPLSLEATVLPIN